MSAPELRATTEGINSGSGGAMGTQVEEKTIVLGFEEYMIRDLTALFRAAYDENPAMRAFSYSEKRLQALIAHAIFDTGNLAGFAVIDMERRTIIGALIAARSGVPFSDEPILTDLLCYVSKDAREGGAISKLVDAYEKMAVRMGIKRLTLSLSEFTGDLDASQMKSWINAGERRLVKSMGDI